MEKAKMKVVKFDSSDVIATSGFTMSGVQDGKTGNIKFGEATSTAEFAALYGGYTFYSRDMSSYTGSDLATYEEDNGNSIFNGTYDYFTGDEFVSEDYGGDGTYTWKDMFMENFYIHQ